MSDVYEKVEYKGERPEYVLKNGKAINVYGMLKDVHLMQGDIAALCEHLANLVAESIALAQFKNDTLRKNICSTDLNEPEWHDYQTIGEAGAYLENLLAKHK